MKRVIHQFQRLFATIFAVLLPLLGFSQVSVIMSTPGAGSWTVPCGVTTITVAVYGGGGGGGGSNSSGLGGGGGGAGGYAQANFAVVPGQIIPYVVGAGGAAGGPAGNGGFGAQSNVFGGTLFALGGTGGQCENNGGGGGAGGSASLWASYVVGAAGASSVAGPGIGGNGGTAGGPNGGAGGIGGASGINGGAGQNFGGGGGGGGQKSGAANPSGGAGSSGAVVFTYTSVITQPNAGPDINLCGITSLSGNTPDPSWTGTWTVVAGSASVTAPNNPTSGFTGLAAGSCATFRWTFTSPGCSPMFDEVTICLPFICNDDPCGATPIAVSTSGCTYTQYSNTGATASSGMVEPGCGNYDDNDVWFSLTVPANGTVTLQALDNGAAGSVYPAIAVYEGTCNNLSHAGCAQTLSTITPSQMTYNGVPGSTIYIRVWDYLDSESGFGLCAFTHTNPTGNVLPGPTSVTCGTPMTFMDPGGTGNYSVNSSADYVICPNTPGQFVSINFSQFALENGFDRVTILDGSGNTAPIIGQWTGTSNPGTITSSAADGCLTVIFQSDNVVTNTGWLASVTCSSTPGTNSYVCSPTNCSGDCGQWICMDGLYPTTNNGNAIEDLAIGTSGCFGTSGEIASRWFYFTILTDGTIEFTFDGPNGQDYDFAVWGPSTDGNPPCPFNTGEGPIRCSYADVSNTSNPVGLNAVLGAGEYYEGVEGNGWVDALTTVAGETYAMILNIYMNGNPQPTIDLTIGGTGTIDCTPVFQPVEMHSLNGINQGERNYVSWITASEMNNDYFTLERSVNGFDWEYAGTVDGAGNSAQSMYYGLHDHKPYFPVTYYRVKQTDFNGDFKYSEIITVNAERVEFTSLVSDLYPNPADGYTAFIYNGEGVSKVNPLNVQVIDEMGNLLINNNYVELVAGMPTTLRTQDLAAGTYNLVVRQGQVIEKKKLVIVR